MVLGTIDQVASPFIYFHGSSIQSIFCTEEHKETVSKQCFLLV